MGARSISSRFISGGSQERLRQEDAIRQSRVETAKYEEELRVVTKLSEIEQRNAAAKAQKEADAMLQQACRRGLDRKSVYMDCM